MFTENQIQISFKEGIIKCLKKPESIDIFIIPVGNIYDLLVDCVDDEEYTFFNRGVDTQISVVDDDPAVTVSLPGHFFLLEDMETPLWQSRYLADRNLSSIPFCQAWANVIETIQALLDENDLTPNELIHEWKQ